MSVETEFLEAACKAVVFQGDGAATREVWFREGFQVGFRTTKSIVWKNRVGLPKDFIFLLQKRVLGKKYSHLGKFLGF